MDNNFIVSGSEANRIVVHTLKDQKLHHKFVEPHPTAEDALNSGVIALSITPDNKYIVSAGGDNTIALWEIAKKEQNPFLRIEVEIETDDCIMSLAVSNNCQLIIAGLSDNQICIWDIRTGMLLCRIQVHGGAVESVIMTYDDRYIVSGSQDQTIVLWEYAKNEQFHCFEDAHSLAVCAVAATYDNNYVVSGSRDKTIGVWHISKKILFHRFNGAHADSILCVTVTKESKYIISGSQDKSIAVWDLMQKKEIHRYERAHHKAVATLKITGDDNHIISGSWDTTIKIWPIRRDTLLHRFNKAHDNYIWSVAATTDKKFIISVSTDKSIKIWDNENKELFHHFPHAHNDIIYSVNITPNDEFIISCSRDKEIGVWSIADKKLVKKFETVHKDLISSVATNNKYIASGSYDKTIGIWDINNLSLYEQVEGIHTGSVNSVALTGGFNHIYLISGSADKSIVLWDVTNKKLLHRFEAAHADWVNSVAVSSNSTYIVSAGDAVDKTIAVWHITQKKLLYRLEGAHFDSISSVTITHDNRHIVSGSRDMSIALWDLAEKKLIHRYERAHPQAVTTVAVTYDDMHIVSAGGNKHDRSIAIWELTGFLNHNLAFHPLIHNILQEIKTHQRVPDNLLVHLYLLPQAWNALNYIIFQLPESAHLSYLDIAADNKIYITVDQYEMTQIEYLLLFQKKAAVHNSQFEFFMAGFFRRLPKLLNFNSLNRNKICSVISKKTQHIFQEHGELNFLAVMNSLFSQAEVLDHIVSELPKSGLITSENVKEFIFLEGLWVDNIKEKVISERQGRVPYSLAYSVMLYDSTSRIDDPTILKILFLLNEVESNQILSPAIGNLIDYLWRNSQKKMLFKCLFIGSILAVFTTFSVINTSEPNLASHLLILLNVLIGIFVMLECFQLVAHPSLYFREPWNYIDMLLIRIIIVLSVLFWTSSDPEAISFFISLSTVLIYTKLLLSFRIIDQLRNLIRMILEVVKDMISFMVVIIVYIVAFALIFYQNRRAYSDDSFDFGNFGNDLMEMFYLIFTGGSYSEYSGTMIPFYLLVTVFQCLVLLNLIISIIGDTFGRVKGSFDIIDLRERIGMLLEVAEEAGIITSVARMVRRIVCCLRGRNISVSASENSVLFKPEFEGKFLLVIEKFEVADESNDVIERIADIKREIETVNSGISNLKGEMSIIMNEMKSEIRNLKAVDVLWSDRHQAKEHNRVND